MRAIAVRKGKFEHDVRVREHRLTADEPEDIGGEDLGPSPQELLAASLASCTAITMRDVRRAQGLGPRPASRSTATTRPPSAAARRSSTSSCGCPDALTDEQVERLQVIAAKCPVHRTLEGEVTFDERVERVASELTAAELADALRGVLLDAGGRRAHRRARPHRRRRARPALPRRRRRACTPSSPSAATTCAATPARSRSPAAAATTATPTCAATALREAARGDRPRRASASSSIGALQPTPTFVTNYAIYPFVGLIEPGLEWTIAAARGRPRCSSCALDDVRAGYGAPAARAPRRPVPHRHLRGRRPPDLGRDGADRRRPARAPAWL